MVTVTFIDEDGQGTAQFDSMAEANDFIKTNEARVNSGEPFEVVSIE